MKAPSTEFRIVHDANCPTELYRFRYEVYVEELGRATSYACHDTRTIQDSLDQNAYQTIVTKGDEIIACIRLNYSNEGTLQPYYDFYELSSVPSHLQDSIIICTLDMVAKPYRRKMVFVRMLQAAFEFSLNRGARICYMDVNPPLVPLFKKLGMEVVKSKSHPDYGDVAIMRFDAHDYENLKAARSPLAPLTKRYLERQSKRKTERNSPDLVASE